MVATQERALAYYRRSKEDDRDEPGVAQQRAAVRQYAAGKGIAIVDDFSDSDLSGWNVHVDRPGFERFLEALDVERPTVVVAWANDRLMRDTGIWADFVRRARRAGVQRVETVTGGSFDLDSAGGLFLGGVMAGVSQFYSDSLSANAKRGHNALADAGRQNGGRRTFGFREIPLDETSKYRARRSNEIDPVEASLIREAATRFLAGEGMRTIALDWNEREIPTVTGARWSPAVLTAMLQNPKLIGKREKGHWEITDRVNPKTGKPIKRRVVERLVDGGWESILDEPTWEQVQARFAAQKLSSHRRYSSKMERWLGTVATCSKCGSPLLAKTINKRHVYHCPPSTSGKGCGGTRIQALPLEARILDEMREALAGSSDEIRALAAGFEMSGVDERRAIVDEIETIETRLEEIQQAVRSGELRPAHAAPILDGVDDDLRAAKARLRDLAPAVAPIETGALDDALAEGIDSLDPYGLRALARLVFESIVVLPAWRSGAIPKGDDPTRGRLEVVRAF